MKRDERLLALAGFLLLFGLATFLAGRLGGPRAGHLIAAAQRKAMPELSARDGEGQPWSVHEHVGKVVLVNFWATWCGPCLEETPGLVKLRQDLGNDLAVVGVSIDAGGNTEANRARVASFAHRFHVAYPLVYPAPGSQMEFGVELIPTTILLDRQGRVAKLYQGETRESVFRADVTQLMAER